jgi:hypothetical protein
MSIQSSLAQNMAVFFLNKRRRVFQRTNVSFQIRDSAQVYSMNSRDFVTIQRDKSIKERMVLVIHFIASLVLWTKDDRGMALTNWIVNGIFLQ